MSPAAVRPLWTEPHHDGSAVHAPGLLGAVLGDDLKVLLRVPHGGTGSPTVAAVHVRHVHDGEPAWTEAQVHHVDDHDVWYAAPLTVRNRLARYRWLLDDPVSGTGYRWVNTTGVHGHDVTDASDFVVSTYPAAPDWAVHGVIYQVFLDRFARSGADHGPLPEWAVPAGWDSPVEHTGEDTPRQLFGGDLAGVEQHLQHLVDLGAKVLYLTPFFPAESNHRYNASSFDTVDPLLGGAEALLSLVRAAHARGLHVVGDLTTNHTGDTHEWFRAAQADATSPEAAYYYFTTHPHDYEAWFDVATLPKLDYASARLRRRIVEGPDSVVARWLRGPDGATEDGLDGWRIDVANMTGRYQDVDLNHEVARLVRGTMDEAKPGSFLLAEHFHDSSSDVTTGAGGWDAVMNYAAFTRPVWEWLAPPDSGFGFLGMPVRVPRKPTADVVTAMRLFAGAVPWHQTVQNVNSLGSHDTPRALSVLGSEEALVAALAILVGYPGVPMVFAGDELGLTGEDGEHARTPMPWDDESRVGAPLHRTYAELLRLRGDTEALRQGGMRWLDAGEDHMAWLRETPVERIAVVVARRATEAALPATLLGGCSPAWFTEGVDVRHLDDEVRASFSGPGAVFLRVPVRGRA